MQIWRSIPFRIFCFAWMPDLKDKKFMALRNIRYGIRVFLRAGYQAPSGWFWKTPWWWGWILGRSDHYLTLASSWLCLKGTGVLLAQWENQLLSQAFLWPLPWKPSTFPYYSKLECFQGSKDKNFKDSEYFHYCVLLFPTSQHYSLILLAQWYSYICNETFQAFFPFFSVIQQWFIGLLF